MSLKPQTLHTKLNKYLLAHDTQQAQQHFMKQNLFFICVAIVAFHRLLLLLLLLLLLRLLLLLFFVIVVIAWRCWCCVCYSSFLWL